MVASRNTVERLTQVLVDELGRDKARQLVRRLIAEVPGNKSFRDTLEAVSRKL